MVETWPVQEFTYLDPEAHRGTTVAERRPAVMEYWAKAAPGHARPNAESLLDLIGRVRQTLDRLASREFDHAFVVTHEMFIQATGWLLKTDPDSSDEDLVRRFGGFRSANSISNLAYWIIEWRGAPGKWFLIRKGEK